MATDTIDLAGFEGGPVSLATKQLDELGSRIRGRLLRVGDQGWDEVVLTWAAGSLASCWLMTPAIRIV